MIEYREESWDEFIIDALPLMKIHNVEANLFNEALDIDFDTYAGLADAGNLKMFTMREEGLMVGYCAYYIFFHSHHKTSLQARQDVLYIKPGKRMKCFSFLSFCDDKLKQDGIKFVQQCVPEMNDFSSILERLGYTKLETIYLRSL